MKTRIRLLALFVSAFSWGQSIFTNPITGTNPNTANPYTAGQVVASNLTVSGIGRGAGANGVNTNDRYNANSWNTATIDLTAYFEFTLTPSSGYLIDFVSFVYTGQTSGTGPTNFAFRSSLDGYMANIGTPTATGTTISLSGALYQGITSAVTFRIYAWGTTNSGGTFSINDFIFNGFVNTSCVPPVVSITPSTGPAGTEVTVSASSGSLTGASAFFGGVPATILSNNGMQMVVEVPVGAVNNGLITITDNQPCSGNVSFTLIDEAITSCQVATVSDLIIYEVHDEQSGDGGTITIYNGTTTTRNLNNYRIFRTGDYNDGNEVNYASLTGSIAPGALGIIKVGVGNCGPASTNGSINSGFNANDGIQLRASDGITVIDDVDVYSATAGYYLKRTGVLIPRVSFVPTDWISTSLISGQCVDDLGTPPSGVAPTVTVQPVGSVSTCSNTTAVLTVTAIEGFVGGLPLVYRWFYLAPGDLNWTPVVDIGPYTGYNNNTLTISPTTGLNGYQFYCQVRENTANCFQASNAVKITDEFITTWDGDEWTPFIPDLDKLAIINGAYSTLDDGNIDACSLIVNSGFTITVNSDTYVNIQNDVTVNGVMNILNNGSLIQINDAGVNTGNINLTRTANIRRLDYVYWSSPVIGFPVLGISPGTPASNVFKWLPTIGGNFGNWTTANENMVRGKGYIVRGPSAFTSTIQPFNATFNGVPNNGIITPDIERGAYTGTGYPSPTNPLITVTANDDNFNLVGNPYPSAIRALDFLNENTNIEGSVRIWTHGLLPDVVYNDPFYNNFAYNYNPNDYIVHNGTGTVSGPSGFNGFIASGQGFFVVMNDGAATTETVTFRNAMRNITHTNNQFFRQVGQLQGESDFKIWIDLIPQNGSPVRTLLGYVDGATNEKDRLYDASTKVDGASKMYSLIGAERFIIQGRSLPFNQNDVVPMGYNATAPGRLTVAIADVVGLEDKKVYLEDKQLNIIHDLTLTPYVFDSEAGTFDGRFELLYRNELLSTPGFAEVASGVIAFASNGQLHVKSSLEKINNIAVYDVLGRLLFSQKGQGEDEFVANTNFSKQTVVVQVELENRQIVTKKVVL